MVIINDPLRIWCRAEENLRRPSSINILNDSLTVHLHYKWFKSNRKCKIRVEQIEKINATEKQHERIKEQEKYGKHFLSSRLKCNLLRPIFDLRFLSFQEKVTPDGNQDSAQNAPRISSFFQTFQVFG